MKRLLSQLRGVAVQNHKRPFGRLQKLLFSPETGKCTDLVIDGKTYHSSSFRIQKERVQLLEEPKRSEGSGKDWIGMRVENVEGAFLGRVQDLQLFLEPLEIEALLVQKRRWFLLVRERVFPYERILSVHEDCIIVDDDAKLRTPPLEQGPDLAI